VDGLELSSPSPSFANFSSFEDEDEDLVAASAALKYPG